MREGRLSVTGGQGRTQCYFIVREEEFSLTLREEWLWVIHDGGRLSVTGE